MPGLGVTRTPRAQANGAAHLRPVEGPLGVRRGSVVLQNHDNLLSTGQDGQLLRVPGDAPCVFPSFYRLQDFRSFYLECYPMENSALEGREL